jgi:hypothetical protein
MNVMQTLSDFKQNLSHQGRPGQAMATQSGVTVGAMAANAGRASTAAPSSSTGTGSTGSGSSTSSTSGTDSTTITANDFLQLLVAEMKNQDPTADQDPNAYIDQLVQVNSLQQLIAINQDLTPTGATASATGAAQLARRASPPVELGSAAGSPAASVAESLVPRAVQPEQAPVGGAGGDSSLLAGKASAYSKAAPDSLPGIAPQASPSIAPNSLKGGLGARLRAALAR